MRAPAHAPRPAGQPRRLSQALASIPGVDLLAGLILGDSVSLLNDPFESFLVAVDLGEVVVGQFSPLLLHRALHLLPISFDSIPVHRVLLHGTNKRRADHSVPDWRSRSWRHRLTGESQGSSGTKHAAKPI
jgi:hypothetical protein